MFHKLGFILTLSLLSLTSSLSYALTYEELQLLIRDRNIKSIDSLLPLLGDEILSNQNLMFRSESLQPASYEQPRVILSSNDKKFIIAYNGDPKLNQLEVIQFREAPARFEFREIVFPNSPESSDPVSFSEINPPKCLKCQRSPDPRPNWDHYPVWKNAYTGIRTLDS